MTPYDSAFAQAAIGQRMLSERQQQAGLKVQVLLARHGIEKSFADIVVEAGWLDSDKAALVAEKVEGHPPLNPQPARKGPFRTPPQQKAGFEDLSEELEKLGYKRNAADLYVDLHPEAAPADVSPRRPAAPIQRRPAAPPLRRPPVPQHTPAPRPPVKSHTSQVTGQEPKLPVTSHTSQVASQEPKLQVTSHTSQVTGQEPKLPVTSHKPQVASQVGAKRQSHLPAGPKKRNPAMLIGIGVGAGILIVILIAVASSGGSQPTDQTEVSAAQPTTPSRPKPPAPKDGATKPPPETEPSSGGEENEDDWARDIAARRKKTAAENETKAGETYALIKPLMIAGKFEEALKAIYALDPYKETEFYKARAQEIADLEKEAVAKRKQLAAATRPPPVKPPEAKKPPAEDLDRPAYERRKTERSTAGLKRLRAAKDEIQADRAAEEKKMAELMGRLAGKTFAVRTKAGQDYAGVSVLGMRRDELVVAFQYEGSSVETTLPWDFIDDRSFESIIRALYQGRDAANSYEMGRRFITRKMWKQAAEAFDACRKADASYADRIPDLDKVLKNQAAFNGASRRIGSDILYLSYDFSSPDQAADFEGRCSKAVDAGQLQLESGLCTIKDVEYVGEIKIESLVSVNSGAFAAFLIFLSQIDGTGYLLTINNGNEGIDLQRMSDKSRDSIARSPVSIAGQAAVRISVKGGEFRVFIDGKEALSAKDTTYSKGICGIGAKQGRAAYSKLSVEGKVNPVEIDKRFAEAEVLVRRALEGDITSRGGGREERQLTEIALSVEDEYFMKKLSDEQKAEYESAKQEAVRILQTGISRREDLNAASLFDSIVNAVPDFYAALYWQGMMYLTVRRTDRARDCFVRCVTGEKGFYEALAAMGLLCEQEQDWGKAATYAEEALKLMPDCSDALGLRGYLGFVIKGDSKAALADLELAIKLDPTNDDARGKQRTLINVIKGPENLGCKYKKEFTHYTIMTDMSMEKTKLYGERLEAAYKYYAETFKDFFKKEDPNRIKPRVAIFNTREAYLTYGELTIQSRQENTLGYFIAPFHELLLFEDVELDETLHVLYHEAFHQFMSMMVARPPFWYNEGIAEYMGSISIGESGTDKGKVVKKGQILERIKVLKPELVRALPFDAIMKQSPGEFYSGPVSFKYGQAWTMIHFFYEYQGGKYRKLIDDYFRALLDGKDIYEAFDAAFGSADLDALKKEWETYVQGMEYGKR